MGIEDIATETEHKISLGSLFEKMKRHEQLVPVLGELIKLGPIDPARPEYSILSSHGVSPMELNSGNIQRGVLLSAGFTFKNTLGAGEKPIIKATIDGVDYEQLKLLTEDQLEAVRILQQSQPEIYGSRGFNLDEVRFDMFSLLLSLNDPVADVFPDHYHTFMEAVGLSRWEKEHHSRYSGSDHEWNLVDKYLQSKHKGLSGKDLTDKESSFLKEYCGDIVTWDKRNNFDIKVRGHQSMIMPQRIKKLYGSPSPFLNSGYRFGPNEDVTVDTTTHPARINMAVLHLLSRGLSEMGNGGARSYDQHYITLGEYVDGFYPKTAEEREAQHQKDEACCNDAFNFNREDVIRRIQKRVIQLAHEWDQIPKPPRFSGLIDRLRRK